MKRVANVNRVKELTYFDSMLANQTPEHILLICAETGWGKSNLLQEFEHRRPASISNFAKLDFKSRIGLTEMFFQLCDALGWEQFSNFKASVQSIIQSTQVSINHNILIGGNQIALALGGPDEQTREARQADLTNAFFTDLRALGRVLLILDSFEKSDFTVRAWLSGSFLPRAQRSPQLFVVLAGQCVPEQAIDWNCCNMALGPIAPEHWLTYAQSLGISIFTLKLIQNCWNTYHGHTLTIATILQAFSPQELDR